MTQRIGLFMLLLAGAIILLFLCLPTPYALGASLVISPVGAFLLAKRTVKPIRELDLSHPDTLTAYKELTPLLSKLQTQTLTIRDQSQDLFRQQKEFKTISENMSEGLLIVDREGKVLSYNSSALRLLDVHPEEDKPDVLTFSQNRWFRKVVDEALTGQHSQQLMRLSDRTYQLIGNPVVEKRLTIGAVLMILDVTEREERDRLRKEFSANVSHELKTPLTAISGFAEIMMHGMAKPEDMSRFAGKIYQEAHHMIDMIGDIIQLSRLDERELADQVQPVDLFSLANAVVQRFSANAEKQKVALRIQGSPCKVEGVPQILEEMIANLCDNAIKYNRPGGSVTVAITPRQQDILLAVTDTGLGIAYEDQSRVFERFFRGDKSHSKQISGTGLGLSIVKHAVQFHDAKISLESTPGEGTCITIVFPLTPKTK